MEGKRRPNIFIARGSYFGERERKKVGLGEKKENSYRGSEGQKDSLTDRQTERYRQTKARGKVVVQKQREVVMTTIFSRGPHYAMFSV